MGKSVPVVTLASAIGFALLGAGFQSSASAHSFSKVDATTGSVAAQTAGSQTYIVTFAEDGLLHYAGGVGGLQATAPAKAAGQRKLDVHSAAAQAYANYLGMQRATHVAAVEGVLGRPLAVTHSYAILSNGIAADLSAAEAARVAAVPGVKSVRAAGVEQLVTYRGPTFIGADKIWDGTATPTHTGTKGQGVLVGDLDGGTNSDHPSFANDPTCGFDANSPKLVAVDCSQSTAGVCDGPNPEANPGYGHGVHTSSTIAGNTIDNTVTPAPALPDGVTMSGVAPCAAIHHYKVCQTNNCGGADIAAGIENAIADQVDVLNFSISGGTSPWNDNDRDFLDAVNADVFVAAAAGNLQAGETDPTSKVNHLGPWVMTVAASTQDEIIGPQIQVTGPGTVPAGLDHIAVTAGSTTVVGDTIDLTGQTMLSYPANIAGCSDTGGFPADYFDGAVALVRRGASEEGGTACSFTEKITNAYNSGAEMVIVANNQPGTISMDTTGAPDVPAFSISDQATGDALIAFVNANNPPVVPADRVFADGFEPAAGGTGTGVDYAVSALSQRQGDVLANFSYRGPTIGQVADETKPDISAPGVDIYAALDDQDGNYGFMSGTSMATPHTTGAGALVRAVHPDWTVQEVKSALMMAATNADGVEEDGTTPWTIDDVGSGRVDLTQAALAGLTMDETYADFVAANPVGGSIEIRDLNLPALRDIACAGTCTWTRTVKNQLATSGTWDVTAETDPAFSVSASPSTFTLAPGATQVITFTATTSESLAAMTYGTVKLTENSGQAPVQHITVAIRGGGTPPPPPTVDCSNGTCNFLVDLLPPSGGSFSVIGCATYCGMIWLNRFSPDAADYPITINSVSTIFGSGTGYNAAGDQISVFVYQDSDDDPSNGATAVGTPTVYTMGAPANAFVTIPLSPPVVVNGPGEVLIALSNPNASNVGARPASADTGPFADRSWIGNSVGTTPPNLGSGAVGLLLNTDAIDGFVGNWLIRATGTNAAGAPIVLDASR